VANGMAIIPIVMGVGLAVLGQGGLGKVDVEEESSPRPWGVVGAVLALGLLVLGIVPNWLSPTATWRAPIGVDSEPRHSIEVAQAEAPAALDVSELCVSTLRADYDAGILPGSRLYGWQVPPAEAP